QMLAAQEAGNEKLANFYVQRFAPDVRKAYDAWMAQKPYENPNAEPHPFVPNLYEMRGTRESVKATTDAAGKLADARAAGNVCGDRKLCHCAVAGDGHRPAAAAGRTVRAWPAVARVSGRRPVPAQSGRPREGRFRLFRWAGSAADARYDNLSTSRTAAAGQRR